MTGWWQAEGPELTWEVRNQLQDALKEATAAGKDVVIVEGITLRWHPAPDSLDAAWADAEAALPDGWEMHLASSKYRQGWVAYANEYQLGREVGSVYVPPVESEPFPGSHATPIAALRALAEKLLAVNTAHQAPVDPPSDQPELANHE